MCWWPFTLAIPLPLDMERPPSFPSFSQPWDWSKHIRGSRQCLYQTSQGFCRHTLLVKWSSSFHPIALKSAPCIPGQFLQVFCGKLHCQFSSQFISRQPECHLHISPITGRVLTTLPSTSLKTHGFAIPCWNPLSLRSLTISVFQLLNAYLIQ